MARQKVIDEQIPCRINGCPKFVYVKWLQLCTGHYKRWQDGGSPDNIYEADMSLLKVIIPRGQCVYEPCSKKAVGRGYCSGHYEQVRRQQKLRPIHQIIEDHITETNKKICVSCTKYFSLKSFSPNKRRTVGLNSRCKPCQKLWEQLYRHNLNQSDYDFLLRRSGGLCEICKQAPAKVIDHSHDCCPGAKSCGKCIRGLLCTHCNVGIGMLKETVDIFQNAVQYLSNTIRLGGNDD